MVLQFWLSLGVEPETAQVVAGLNLECHDGFLYVNESAGPIDFALVQKVSLCLSSLMKFPQYTDSRWVSVGRSCRCLVAALCGGFRGLMEMTREDPEVSDYYLHGFSQLGEGASLYACIAAMTSQGTDALLAALLHDDRLGLCGADIDHVMADRLLSLEKVNPYTWNRLAGLLTEEQSGNFLKDKCLCA